LASDLIDLAVDGVNEQVLSPFVRVSQHLAPMPDLGFRGLGFRVQGSGFRCVAAPRADA